MNPWVKVGVVLLIALAGYAAGHHVSALAGTAALSNAQAGWEKERGELARENAAAVNARMLVEHARELALNQAAEGYEQGKTDAQADAARTIAELDAGTRRLRDDWATCRATSAAVSAVASRAGEPDGEARLRTAGIGRVLRIVGECQAQRDALQDALTGERAAVQP